MGTIITGILALSAIGAVLAAALVLTNRIVNNYGICTININEGSRELEVQGGDTLLSALGQEKIFIPSACGGRGSCGLCKVTVNEGGGMLLPTEEPHLTEDEIEKNVRLSCQLKVRSNMQIQIPEALFKIREYSATVEKLEDLTHDIKLLRLALKSPETIDFTPGQYIQLECPKYKMNPVPVYRAYSIASDPSDNTHLDLIVRLVPKGICTTWVFDFLQEGDPVTFNGPHGDFAIRESDKEMIFIAGGSGMAPFRSILADLKQQGCQRTINYYFGARTEADLFLTDAMRQYEQALPGFTYVPALSDPKEDTSWEGDTGLITDVVGKYNEDCSDKQGYLCGSPGMIDACIEVLTKNGMPEEEIYYDKFA